MRLRIKASLQQFVETAIGFLRLKYICRGDSMMDSSKVTLWTRQDIKSLDDLENQGVYRVQSKYIDDQFGDIADHYKKSYNWFNNAANKMVHMPRGVEFPIWCSISYENMLRPIENTVCYELELNKSDVIYFDGGKWDYVLNHIYIPKDYNDAIQYKNDMEAKGFQNTFSFFEGKYANLYPLEKKRIMDSWERIFKIEDWNIFTVQANIWEIRPEMIKKFIHYESGDLF